MSFALDVGELLMTPFVLHLGLRGDKKVACSGMVLSKAPRRWSTTGTHPGTTGGALGRPQATNRTRMTRPRRRQRYTRRPWPSLEAELLCQRNAYNTTSAA